MDRPRQSGGHPQLVVSRLRCCSDLLGKGHCHCRIHPTPCADEAARRLLFTHKGKILQWAVKGPRVPRNAKMLQNRCQASKARRDPPIIENEYITARIPRFVQAIAPYYPQMFVEARRTQVADATFRGETVSEYYEISTLGISPAKGRAE